MITPVVGWGIFVLPKPASTLTWCPRATAFGVVRALSLRFKTNDMSCKYRSFFLAECTVGTPLADTYLAGTYALASLWSSLELFIGIIAANVALSRSIYRVLRPRKSSESQIEVEHAAAAGFKRKTAFPDYQFEASSIVGHGIAPSHRAATLTSHTEGSDVWLRPGS